MLILKFSDGPVLEAKKQNEEATTLIILIRITNRYSDPWLVCTGNKCNWIALLAVKYVVSFIYITQTTDFPYTGSASFSSV